MFAKQNLTLLACSAYFAVLCVVGLFGLHNFMLSVSSTQSLFVNVLSVVYSAVVTGGLLGGTYGLLCMFWKVGAFRS